MKEKLARLSLKPSRLAKQSSQLPRYPSLFTPSLSSSKHLKANEGIPSRRFFATLSEKDELHSGFPLSSLPRMFKEHKTWAIIGITIVVTVGIIGIILNALSDEKLNILRRTLKNTNDQEAEAERWENKYNKLKEEYDQLKEKYDTVTDSKELYEKMQAFQDKLQELEPDLENLKKKIMNVFDKQILSKERDRIENEYKDKLAKKNEEIRQQKETIKALKYDGTTKQVELQKLNALVDQKNELEKKEKIEIAKLDFYTTEIKKLETILNGILSSAQLSEKDMKALNQAFHRKTDFNGLTVSPFGLQCLTVIMQQLWIEKPIQKINFSKCRFNLSGPVLNDVSNILSKLSVEELHLDHNYLHHYNGASAVANIIEETNTIKILVLNNNSLNDDDIEIIAKALEKNKSIEKLILHTNSFTSRGKARLQSILDKNSALKIDVSNNYGEPSLIERSATPTVARLT